MSDFPQYDPPPSPPQPARLAPDLVESALRRCKAVRAVPLRSAIERFLYSPERISDEDASTIITSTMDVSAWRWRESEVAFWALGRMPLSHERRKQAAAALAGFLKRDKFDGFYQVAIAWWGGVVFVTGIIAMARGADLAMAALVAMGGACGFAPFVWLAARLWGDLRFNQLRASSIESLGLIGSAECAEAVVAAMYETMYARERVFQGSVRQAAALALPRVLASLTPDCYLRMSARFVPNLCHLLNHVKEPLQRDILNALGRMGDGRAVFAVQRFIAKTDSKPLRKTAESVLPILERRQIQETAHSTLLRASAAPDDAPNVLLRPAYGGYEDPPQQLLRPAEASAEASVLEFDLNESAPAE